MRAIAYAVAASCLFVPLRADQNEPPRPGSKIAVVALRDSALFTLCPVIGKDVVESNIWTDAMKAKVTVGYGASGLQSLGFHFGDVHGKALLPRPVQMPAMQLDLTPDPTGQSEIETAIRARSPQLLLEPLESAELVLVVESSYLERSVDTFRGGTTTVVRQRRSREGTWRQVALAVLVPASAYEQHKGDGIALARAATWQGMSFWRMGNRDQPAGYPAAVAELADQLVGKGLKQPPYLPVCGLTTSGSN